ncbi:hypothetical protein F990_03284 [Acinetobacter tjernbergiae DSM 14971 = CIP 107465]|uniref:Uncharacterized protein n=1 Tax=Acinetobacter tjernbergiae DSM 14971 = CIP 107465 TaxID=1120928 RepID=V2W0R8_9GAMM|nr:hypothetical protein F990_03284 [Acinetobacter tjernbergiae DSM 14971 = CIP 107465]
MKIHYCKRSLSSLIVSVFFIILPNYIDHMASLITQVYRCSRYYSNKLTYYDSDLV